MKELITLEGDLQTHDFQIVALEGEFEPYADSLNGESDTLEGDLIVDKAIIDIPLNGKIYTYEMDLNGGFKMPKVKMPKMPKMPKAKMPKMKMPRVRVNTKGLSKSVSSIGQGISKGASAIGKSASSAVKAYGDMVSHNIGQIGEIAQGAIGAGGGLLSSLLNTDSSNSDVSEEQTDETTQEEYSDDSYDEGLENLPNEDNEELNGILSTIGSAAGSFLMPGVGTAAGGMIGNLLESGGGGSSGGIGSLLSMGQTKKPTVKKATPIKKRKATPRDTARISNLKAKQVKQTSISQQNQSAIFPNQQNQNTSYPQQPQRQIALKSYPNGSFSLSPRVRKAEEEPTDSNPTGNENNPPATDPNTTPTVDPNNPPAKKKDDNTMFIIGGVAVAGFLMFSMNKKGRK